MNTELSAAWDRHADTYARLFSPLTGYIARAMVQTIARRLPPRWSLLDVACGSGAATLPAVELSLRDGQGHVTATDFSAAMVELTRRGAEALGASSAMVRCEVQDGERLTYADASFDAVVSSFGIFLFGDRRAGWREAARVLRTGGVFATAVWRGPAENPMLRAQMMPVAAALPERLRTPPAPGSWMEIADADALAAEVAAAGPFADVRVRPFQATIALSDLRDVWGAMRENPVMGQVLARCTPAELEVVREGLEAHLAEVAGGIDQPLLLDASCNLLTATRA